MKKSIFLVVAFLISVSLFSAFNIVSAADNHLKSYVPENYNLEYGGQVNRREFFIIYSPDDNKYEMYYERWEAKFGAIDNLKEIKVRDVTKLFNGTIIVDTAKGVFFFPDVNDKNKCPTFNNKVIEVDNQPKWDKCK